MKMATEQEVFWKGEFGNDYIGRNKDQRWLASNVAFFAKILDRTHNIQSVLELGSNIGLNLMAIKQLLPKSRLSAIEINEKAGAELKCNIPEVDLHLNSILNFKSEKKWDLVFTKAVLIHINPYKLPKVYDLMYCKSSRYILVSEYYNPTPTEVVYRGHKGKLFKRDFCGEMMDKYPDLSLVDYGFVYHRDRNFSQDDISWFLLEKRRSSKRAKSPLCSQKKK